MLLRWLHRSFKRDNVGTLAKSRGFSHVPESLKSATTSSGNVLLSSGQCLSFGGFNERRSQTVTHIAIVSEWIVEKRRRETCTSCYPMCLGNQRSYIINVNTALIYRSHKINHFHRLCRHSCRCVGDVVNLFGRLYSFMSWHLLIFITI